MSKNDKSNTLDNLGRFSDPALLILASLAGGEKHGYAMIEDIEAMSDIKLGAGTLYGALTRLEAAALIEAIETDDRRKPYRLTAEGQHALNTVLNKMHRFTRIGLDRLAGDAS